MLPVSPFLRRLYPLQDRSKYVTFGQGPLRLVDFEFLRSSERGSVLEQETDLERINQTSGSEIGERNAMRVRRGRTAWLHAAWLLWWRVNARLYTRFERAQRIGSRL